MLTPTALPGSFSNDSDTKRLVQNISLFGVPTIRHIFAWVHYSNNSGKPNKPASSGKHDNGIQCLPLLPAADFNNSNSCCFVSGLVTAAIAWVNRFTF